jgi:thiosulfate/3-mercaptopyruvate sulfurtransferase
MQYAHPESLVSTDWLARHLDAPDVRVVDGSFKMPGVTPTAKEDYQQRHIPGAVFFDIDAIADHASALPHMLPSADAFANAVGALGVGDGDRVVVYDSYGLQGAARAWWMFRAFGHERVAALDGGLPKWIAEGRPLEQGAAVPTPRTFTPRFDRAVVRDRAQMVSNLRERAEQVVDARSAGRFFGTEPEPRAGLRAGHIPGSRNLPYDELVDPALRTVLPPEELRERFRRAGIALDRPVVATCGSGVTACALAFGLHLLGAPRVAVYDGSWAEWGAPGETPVETDAADVTGAADTRAQ